MVNDVMPITGSAGPVAPKKAARLCNFATGSDREDNVNHQKWLGQMVLEAVRPLPRVYIIIEGFASKRGNADFNYQLSLRRCKAVENFIRLLVTQVDPSLAGKIEYFTDIPKGESESDGAEDDNSGYWRAVTVYVYETKPPTPPVQPPPPQPAATKSVIVRREYNKISAENYFSGPNEDLAKDITQSLIDLAGNAVDPEGSMAAYEIKGGRQTATHPATARVNRVTIDTKNTFDVVGSGGSVSQTSVVIKYEWGEPQENVSIISNQINESNFGGGKWTNSVVVARAKAEKMPFVVPPKPGL